MVCKADDRRTLEQINVVQLETLQTGLDGVKDVLRIGGGISWWVSYMDVCYADLAVESPLVDDSIILR